MQSILQIPANLKFDQIVSSTLKVSFSSEVVLKQSQSANTLYKIISEHNQQLKAYDQQAPFYQYAFARAVFLIKLNSLARQQSPLSNMAVAHLVNAFNQLNDLKIKESSTERDFVYQLLQQTGTYKYMTEKQLENIAEGQSLLNAILCFSINKARLLTTRMQIAFSLSFVALQGRPTAFTPIVHEQKNHKGQLHYAKRIGQLVQIQTKQSIQTGRKVQDPYSMRCSPHVHGVVYDTIEQSIETLNCSVNGFFYKNIIVEGQEIPNMDLLSNGVALKIDFLMAACQQIGSMSFLRSERMLNRYLGNNILQEHAKFKSLNSQLQRVVALVGQNKILSAGSNTDSVNYNSYQKDIFHSQSAAFNKYNKIFKNLDRIMHLQLRTALNVVLTQQFSSSKQMISEQLKQNVNTLRKLLVHQNCPIQRLLQQWKSIV